MEYTEDIIRCYCCELGYGAFDITFFRGFPLCDHCFNNDNVLRTCMELHQAERAYMQAEQHGSSVKSEAIINELKRFCFEHTRKQQIERRLQSSEFICNE
jgi:hypothetical protein